MGLESGAKDKNGLAVPYTGAKFGALAGFIATWSISTAIAGAELGLGLPISTFYSIMGISLGLNDVAAAAYTGFGLHLLAGTLLGAALGGGGIRWRLKSMLDPYRDMVIGAGAGFGVWLLVFLPVTVLFVQPSISNVVILLALELQTPVLSDDISKFVTNILLVSIPFHLVWGAIFGFIMSSLLRIRLAKMLRPKT